VQLHLTALELLKLSKIINIKLNVRAVRWYSVHSVSSSTSLIGFRCVFNGTYLIGVSENGNHQLKMGNVENVQIVVLILRRLVAVLIWSVGIVNINSVGFVNLIIKRNAQLGWGVQLLPSINIMLGVTLQLLELSLRVWRILSLLESLEPELGLVWVLLRLALLLRCLVMAQPCCMNIQKNIALLKKIGRDNTKEKKMSRELGLI
jgi:hypothetical protein